MKEEKQRLKDTEQALKDKGIQGKDFDELLQLLESRKNAINHIESARKDQFYGYAFQVMSRSSDPQAAAKYLRKVVKHIVNQALQIADQHETVDDILDAIEPIGDVET